MKFFLQIFIVSFLVSFLIFQNSVQAGHLNFTLRTGGCNSDELCIFSMYNYTNSHAASCGTYDWSVCGRGQSTVNLRNQVCNSNEGGVITLFNSNNAHAETYNLGNYNYSYCTTPAVTCSYGSSAGTNEVPVVSLYNQTNSHTAESAINTNKIFCRDTAVPTITVTSPINASYTSLTVNANITTDDQADVGMYSLDGNANVTMTKISSTSFGATITSTKGVHTIKFYANDTVGNMGASSTVTFTIGSSIILVTGTIRESLTGQPTEGNVTVIVKESGQSVINYTTGGTFTTYIPSQIRNFQSDLVTLGIFVNTTDQRVGYSVVEINAGGNVISSPNCVSKQWHFNGTAVSSSTGSGIAAGNISVLVRNSAGNIFSNSTGFNSRVWDIYLTPCLVPGQLSTFEFTITNGTATGYFSIRQVAK